MNPSPSPLPSGGASVAGSAYGVWMLVGIFVTACFWMRAAKRDRRLPVIYFAALLGALVGAKLVYLLAEGWRDWGQPDQWARWATGKSVLGSLLFGYLAVEWTKRVTGYAAATGDWFALVTPIGIGMGRIGCWSHGCCLGQPVAPAWWAVVDAAGVPRWPSVPLELGFNAVAFLVAAGLYRAGVARGQLFHLYLMAYGLFRFAHEFVRDTPRMVGPLSGYQVAALAVFVLGAVRYGQRARATVAGGAGR